MNNWKPGTNYIYDPDCIQVESTSTTIKDYESIDLVVNRINGFWNRLKFLFTGKYECVISDVRITITQKLDMSYDSE